MTLVRAEVGSSELGHLVEIHVLGRIQTVPSYIQFAVSLPQLGVDLSVAQAKAYWLGAEFVGSGKGSAFNPQIGAGMYMDIWLLPLGKLAKGTYAVHATENWTHSMTDLMTARDGKPGPLIAKPMSEPLDFTFSIK